MMMSVYSNELYNSVHRLRAAGTGSTAASDSTGRVLGNVNFGYLTSGCAMHLPRIERFIQGTLLLADFSLFFVIKPSLARSSFGKKFL